MYNALAMGIDCGYDTKKGALQKYAAACQFVQPDFTFTAKCDDKGGKKTLSCSYFHKVSGDMQLGVAIGSPPRSRPVASHAARRARAHWDRPMHNSPTRLPHAGRRALVRAAKPLSKPDVAIEFGTAYKLDKDTTVKAKVDSEGILCTSYKQKISALTTMTLAAQVDTVNLSDNKHKFGLALNITP